MRGQANYAASKAGTVGMIKSVAAEAAARNVTANCVAPGFIETLMTDGLHDKQKTAILAAVPMGKLGQGERCRRRRRLSGQRGGRPT